MKIAIYLSAALILLGLLVAGLRAASAGSAPGNLSQSGSRRPELEYFKAINRVAPPQDPQLLFLLMAEYSNANLQNEAWSSFLRG
jgi:hypothetical protein